MTIDTRDDAVRFLDDRIGQGVKPGLDRVSGALAMLGDPHLAFPVIHVAGTNGKTTTVRMVRDVLGAHGLHVGTFVSPHLHRIEGRYTLGGRTIDSSELIQGVADIAPFVEMYEAERGECLTYFEVTTVLGFSLMAQAAVDAGVVEVGLGGRLDATNVVRADVSVVTGIAMDHMAYLGNSLSAIAGEKAAILKEGGTLVTGPLDPAAEGPITARVAETGSQWFRFDDAYGVDDVDWLDGRWGFDVHGVHDSYRELELGLHGRHQVDHFALAVVSAELFFGRPLAIDAVREASAAVTSPGRIEVAGHDPLVVVDGAHNAQGIEGLAASLDTEFGEGDWVLVTGWRGDRDIGELLAPLTGLVRAVVATEAADPEAIPADVVAAAAAVLGAERIDVVPSVPAALDAARRLAGPSGAVVVAGSLYVAGEAREALGLSVSERSPVHRRFEASDFLGDDEDLDEMGED